MHPLVEQDEAAADKILIDLARQAAQEDGKALFHPNSPYGRQVSIECVKVEENQDGYATVSFEPEPLGKGRVLLNAENMDDEYSPKEYKEELKQEDEQERFEWHEMPPEELQNKLDISSDQYKRGIIHIEQNEIFVKVSSGFAKDGITEVYVENRWLCGRAFDGDDVVIEISHTSDENKKIYGSVVGILKRHFNPRMKSFVCMVDKDCMDLGMMIPVNPGIPKIRNLVPKGTKVKKNCVAVYRLTKSRNPVFDRYVPVKVNNRERKLFVVRFLKWNPQYHNPLGIVVDDLDPGDSIEAGMKVLNIEHNIPDVYDRAAEQEASRHYPPGYKLPDTIRVTHKDLTDLFVCTIDPQGSKDLDDALSVQPLSDGSFSVGVHIADVSFFIPSGGQIDQEACSRATTFYPATASPIHMLPHPFCTDICSLLPGRERLTISIFFTILETGIVVKVDNPFRSIIRSKGRLTYTEAERFLDMTNTEICDLPQGQQELARNLNMLMKLSEAKRKVRLGSEFYDCDLDEEDKDAPRAHILVQEMMLLANREVAKLLLRHFPSCVPLRRQLPPNGTEVDSWLNKHQDVARNSYGLRHVLAGPDNVCRCVGKCNCTVITSQMEKQESSTKFADMYVLREKWQQVLECIDESNDGKLQLLLGDMDIFPQQTLAKIQWFQLQDRASYVCSGDLKSSVERRHHDLNFNEYTHFTSPIRRYIDLIVHRLLCSLITSQQKTYTQEEITDICSHCTEKNIKAKCYERETSRLETAINLKETGLPVDAIVESLSDRGMKMHFYTGLFKALSEKCFNLIMVSQFFKCKKPQ